MSEPTRGPWKAEAYNSRMGSLISFGDISKGEVIGIVYAQRDPAEAQANARLVEAAPELLEACRDALIYLQQCANLRPKKLVDAIVKAEGR